MILTGPEIARLRAKGDIQIDPWDVTYVNPASVDLRLGEKVLMYLVDPSVAIGAQNRPEFLDPLVENTCEQFEIPKNHGIIIHPGKLYLMHTLERVWARSLAPATVSVSRRCGFTRSKDRSATTQAATAGSTHKDRYEQGRCNREEERPDRTGKACSS